MKRLTKAVYVLLSIFPLLALAACAEKDQEAAQKITESLEKKYDEEFVVDRIGGGYGTFHTNTIKAIVHPKGSKYQEFKVEITMDYEKIWDSYMNVIMAEQLNQELHKNSAGIFESDFQVKSFLSTPGMSYPDQILTNRDISLKEYLGREISASIYVLVNSPSVVEPAPEAEKIMALASEAQALGIQEAFIRVFYLKSDSYLKLNQEQEHFVTTDKAYTFLSSEQNSSQQTWVRIEHSAVLQSAEDIISNFK